MAEDFGIYGTLLERVGKLLDAAKEDIQARMAAEDINASGRTSRSFRVERYDGGIRLVMGGYIHIKILKSFHTEILSYVSDSQLQL